MSDGTWHPTACILCECNCGIEVRLGGEDGRRFERIRGDKAHPASAGLHVREGAAPRPLPERSPPADVPAASPPRRHLRGDRLGHRHRRGGRAASPRCATPTAGSRSSTTAAAGRGTTSAAPTRPAPRAALGSRFRSNALAQEKTGEFWVNGKMLGTHVRGDFEHAEVALFVGKNPWQTPRHSARPHDAEGDRPRSGALDDRRSTRAAPRRPTSPTSTSRSGPAPTPGASPRSAPSSSQEDLLDRPWLAEHAAGGRRGHRPPRQVDIPAYCAIAGRRRGPGARGPARRLAGAAASPSSRTSACRCRCTPRCRATSRSWCGCSPATSPSRARSTCRPASSNIAGGGCGVADRRGPARSPAPASSRASCRATSIAEEILTDHPDRYRAMLVESGNPAHSLADSQRMREALVVARLLVVIDVAMTETARLAHYVLPVPSQFEKYEATFFNFDFPRNVFHLRRPLLEPLPGHAGRARDPRPPRARRSARSPTTTSRRCARPPAGGRAAFADAFFAAIAANPELGQLAPIVLYRTLGPTLPDGAAAAAAVWGAAQRCAQEQPRVGRGAPASPARASNRASGSSTRSSPARPASSFTGRRARRRAWRGLRTDDGRVHLAIPELLDELDALAPRTRRPAIGRVPVRAVGRRAPVVHRQHDHPRPVVAEEGRGRRAAGQPRRCRTARRGRRRSRARHHQARAAWSPPSRSPT